MREVRSIEARRREARRGEVDGGDRASELARLAGARAKHQRATRPGADCRLYRRYSCPEGPATMSLRRPPTRVELKADDIIEYEEVGLLVCVGRKGEKCGIAKQ